MAFVDPILIPKSKEDEWSTQISDILLLQLKTEKEIPHTSIFLVPEVIKKHKPEAYEPQQIGLGPNYHFKPWPYKKMEQRKLTAVRRVLQHCNVQNFEEEVINKVWDRVCDIRGCYDMFLQDEDRFLAWIFTIDGLFLLFLLHSYTIGVDDGEESYELQRKSKEASEHVISVDVDTRRRLFAQDLLMEENQIPSTVLKEIDIALNSALLGNSIQSDYNLSDFIFPSFCKWHSPLELCSLPQDPRKVQHLLDYMYHAIVNNNIKSQDLVTSVEHSITMQNTGTSASFDNNIGPQELATAVDYSTNKPGSSKSKEEKDSLIPKGNIGTGVSFGKIGSPIITLVQKLPWEKLPLIYQQLLSGLETFSKNRTEIYSASDLKGAGFKFHLVLKNEGLCKIDIKAKKIYLPCVTLHSDSEVILRNLVVYERLMANFNNFPLSEYVGLMCGLIVNVNDVKLLKKEKIIEGDLPEDEVAKLFSEMSSSISAIKPTKKSLFQEQIVQVNTIFESQRSMSYMLLKKIAIWLLVGLKAIGMLAGSSLNIIAFIISIMTVFLLTSQAYCEAYGCAKTNVSLLRYAPFSHTG